MKTLSDQINEQKVIKHNAILAMERADKEIKGLIELQKQEIKDLKRRAKQYRGSALV